MSTDPRGTERKNLYAFAIQCAKETGARTILDSACGDGAGTHMLASGIPSAEVIGLDIDPALIRGAGGRFQAPHLAYVAGDARRTPFQGGEFDCVISLHTVEHFTAPDQKIFLGEVRRILRPGGTLCIATPDRDVWGMQGIAGVQADHVKELNQKECIEIVSGSGFRVENVFGQSALRAHRSALRPYLNLLRKLDIFHARHIFFGEKLRDRIDATTQPVHADTEVLPLKDGEKASVTVLICKKSEARNPKS